jgi:hypothetical protein
MLKRLLPLAAIAVLGFVGAVLAADKDKDAKADEAVKGTFTKFDATTGALTITDDKGKDQTFTLSKDVKITCDGKDCKMDDVAAAAKDNKLKGATVSVTGTAAAPKTVDIKTAKAADKDKAADKK